MDTTQPGLLLRVRDPADTDAWELFDSIYRPILGRFARTWARRLGLEVHLAEDWVQE